MIIIFPFFVNLFHLLSAVDELERLFRVSESVPEGYSIGFIHGQPSEDRTKQNFFIVFPPSIDGKDNGAAEKLLHVDERTGEIALGHGQTLDYEREHQLYVLAVPVDGSTPVSLIIEVQDENDNTPQFPDENFRLEISEYARINTVLGLPLARDADTAPYDVQRYRITSGNVNNVFRLAQTKPNGAAELELAVNGRLDREYRSKYELLIDAIDGGQPPKIGTLRVQIEVLDANDNHPEFIQPRYSARISPNTAPGIPILRVGAKDPDAGENGRVEYGIISQSIAGNQPPIPSFPSAPFQLDAQTGTLSLGQTLPMLAHSITFDLLITARDQGVPNALESSTTVEVFVDGKSDVLDGTSNAVSLSVIWLTDDGNGENVPEGLPLGYVLARIAIERPFSIFGADGIAKDQQTHFSDNLNLSLLGAQSMVCLRETDTEHIYLLIICGPFDREQMPTLHMDLLVRNLSDVLLDHPLRLTLLDINDNAPRWNQTQFQFQWTLGIYEFNENPNDNFDDDIGFTSNEFVNTHGIGTNYVNYIRLVATDADAGENERIRYSLIGNDVFNIEPEQGILLIDEDKLPNCPMDNLSTFQVQAEDFGHPSPLHSRANVTVRFVYAEAAQRVHFVQSVYEVRVTEDAQPDTCILQVSAINDGLCAGPKNSSPSPSSSSADDGMHYSLEGSWSDLFKLDEFGGMLCIKKTLHLEQHGQKIQLKAIAKHNDGTIAEAQVIVNIEDVNNHSPEFQPSKYAIEICPEMLKSQMPLLRVRAVDLDNTAFADVNSVFGKIHYHLGHGVGTELFEIDEFDGILRLNEHGIQKLSLTDGDGEKNYELELRVEAADEGGLTSDQSALINVHFASSRTNCFCFAEPIFHFRVSEETLPGIAIGTLRMLDNYLIDGIENIRLEIMDDSESARLFKFDETNANKLLLKAELDSDMPGGEAHLLNVQVIDTEKNCTIWAQIYITVLDVNDNAPTFDTKRASIKLAEDFPIHKPFYAVKATDRDRNENGQITYDLFETDPSSVPIQIHPNSGILSLSAPLDAESSMFRNRSILLRVRARDHGIPPRHDIMELHITILDVNDNAPLFTLPEYEIEVAEDADLMTTVYHIQATDGDSTIPNSRIRYSIHQTLPVIEESANTSILGINKWTGEIFLREQLDREHCAKYSFEVEARDSGMPSRMARAQLHLRVQDINDNAPVCTPQQQVIMIPPGQAPAGGTRKAAAAAALSTQRVGRVQANDPDAGLNGTVRFRMQQPNEWFELDAKGDLFLQRPIDFGHATATSSPFPRSIILIAEDQSSEMPLSSVCQLLIVVDQNGTETTLTPNDASGGDDGIHLLAPVQTELCLNGQTPIGTALVQVNATGVQKWSIRSDDALASLFSISADGTIRLVKSPTTEEEASLDNANQSIITIQMDPSFDGTSPKYLPFVLRRQKQMDEQNNEFAPVTITITVPSNWSLLWQKPLYTVENKLKNWTDQMFFQLEPIGLESEKALQQGLFVLDELQGAFYMAKFPHPNCADNKFGFRVMARSLSDQFVYEKAVQLININLTNWRQNANHRQLRCAKTYQQWSISESVPIGTLIGRVNILDDVSDSSSTHKFSFVNANATPNFRVDEFDGNVYIQKALDRNLLSHVLLMEVSKLEDYGGTTVTRCAIRVNVQADTDQLSNRTNRNAIRFLSAPNATIFMANLEQNLYPNGNVVHHFVAATTSSGHQRQDGRITFQIAAGNRLGAFVLQKDGALSVPDPSKITKNSTIFRLTIRAQIGDKKTQQQQQHREQHFIARIDQSNRKFVYFTQKHFLAEILVDNSLPKGQQQFVAKFKRPDISLCVNFTILPSLEGFKIDEENGTLEFVGTANEVDALFKTSHNLTLTVLVKRCNNNSSSSNKTTEHVPSAGAIDHAFVTVVPHRTVGGGPKIEPTSCGNVSVPENEDIPQLLRIRTLLDDRTTTTDEFTASPAVVVYAIEGGHWHNANLFHIDPNTGWISSTKPLDRETMAEHLLMVSATDLNTVPKKVDMCTVFIIVTDRNDNAPVFKQSVTEQLFLPSTASVGHKLAQFEANDADEGKNGEIHFIMDSDPSEMFDIDWQTGELIFARKSSSSITDQSAAGGGAWITVKAVDNGHPNALESEPKRIHISWDSEMMMINSDHNNSNNKTSHNKLLAFARQTVVANVPEGHPSGQFVAQLNVLNHNGISALSFSILPAGNHDSAFHVDNAGRVSTVLELDAEIRQHYALQIVAVDNANGQKVDTWLQINVLDANDNGPFIAQNGGVPIQLMEDLPIGSLVSMISATDADITPTQLEYSLGNLSSAMFEINRWNGKVHLVRNLDFELAQQHILTVFVTDGVNRVTTNLSVEVLDVNDNGPQFVQPYIEIERSMDVPIWHILTKVEAIDGDMSKNNSQIRYTLEDAAAFQNLSTADLDWLHCDQNNGELRLRRSFTDQIRTKFDRFFVIKATDSGQPPLSAYCVVRVTLIPSQNNVNEPIFDRQNYTFTLYENAPLHQSIGRLTMRRRPFSNLLNCDFQLSSLHFLNNASSHPPKFRIHFDGQIFVDDLLDRESDGEWLNLEASVGNCPPRRATLIETTTFRHKVGVQIRLLDTNDNAPKFDEENNTKTLLISDSIKTGTLLTRFNATDKDATEENSRLSYHLLAGDNFKQFSIDSTSGELRICHWHDAFALSLIDNFPTQLIISARDNGTPTQSAEWVVELLLDMNKWSGSKPHFGVPIYRKFVPEDRPVGTKLFNVYAGARHGISQQNATKDGMMAHTQNNCTYVIQQPKRANIVSSSLIEAFAVEPTTGDVILSAPIDLETANISMAQQQQQQQIVILNFTISCNASQGKIVANVPLEIRVFGIDEFAPTFTKNAYTFKLPSNFDITKPIGQVVAVDRDIGYGSTVRYSLDRIDTASAQYIQINADNGILTMVRWPSAAVGNGSNSTTKGEARVLRFTVWAMSNGWAYGSEQQQQHGKRSSATVYIEMGNFSSFNPTLAGDDHSLLSSFDLLSLMVLPTLFLCFCLLSVLVLTRLLRSQGTAASKNGGISNFLRPAAPKKRMFSVATCRELQRYTKETAADSNTNGAAAPSAAPFFSPSVESGLFSYVKRTTSPPGAKPVRETLSSFHHHARSAVPSSARSASSNYVNVPNRTPSRLATIGNGSRRSAPDSGIVDPDTRSLASEDSCAPADAFLAALGVVEQIPSMHKAKQPQTTPAEAAMNSLKQQHHQQYNDRQRMNNMAPGDDAFLDDLIYACMDEIVPVQCQRTTTVHDVASSSNRNNNSNNNTSTFVPQSTTADSVRSMRMDHENQAPFLLTISKRLIEMEAQTQNSENGSVV